MWKLASLAILFVLFAAVVLIDANPHRGYGSSEEFGGSSEERYYPRRGGYGKCYQSNLQDIPIKSRSM